MNVRQSCDGTRCVRGSYVLRALARLLRLLALCCIVILLQMYK